MSNNLTAAADALKKQTQPAPPKGVAAAMAALQAINQPAQAVQAPPAIDPIRLNMEKIQTSMRTERLTQALTQRELAIKANMSQGSITRAERHGWVSINCILKIANALGKELILN